jgi:hypothetical protein
LERINKNTRRTGETEGGYANPMMQIHFNEVMI